MIYPRGVIVKRIMEQSLISRPPVFGLSDEKIRGAAAPRIGRYDYQPQTAAMARAYILTAFSASATLMRSLFPWMFDTKPGKSGP